ncbi:MAG: heme-binding protein [Bacteroidota bacterium]|nr:heme-binding protein [Bacteroidota bacterium]
MPLWWYEYTVAYRHNGASSTFIYFLFIQNLLIMATAKTETQPYKVLLSKDNFEIRFYPAVTMATITSSAKSYKELGNSGFRKLAGYIFGGNQGGQKISMTTPVHMDINDTLSTMSFVMPSTYNPENLPKPDNQEVTIKTVPDEYVAAIKFGGYATDEDIRKNREKLKKALNENGITFYGNFRFLGYNSPFRLLGRRNEIIVSVKWDVRKKINTSK